LPWAVLWFWRVQWRVQWLFCAWNRFILGRRGGSLLALATMAAVSSLYSSY
jgi:hypothetical protein